MQHIAEPKAVDPKFGNPKVADGCYSRRGEFDTQKATLIPSKKTETSQGKDTAAGRTAAVKSSVSKKRAITSPANAKQPLFITNQAAPKHISMTLLFFWSRIHWPLSAFTSVDRAHSRLLKTEP